MDNSDILCIIKAAEIFRVDAASARYTDTGLIICKHFGIFRLFRKYFLVAAKTDQDWKRIEIIGSGESGPAARARAWHQLHISPIILAPAALMDNWNNSVRIRE